MIKLLSSNSILKSTAGLVGITLLVKVFGYAEKIILAKYFGTSYQADVYAVVILIVLSIFFFFREIVEPGFLNVFLSALGKGKENIAWNLFNRVLRVILVTTVIISIVSVFMPEIFTRIFAPGFEGDKRQLCNIIVKIAVPASIFLALSTLTSITLNGLKIFVLPASAELVFKGLIIICIVLFYNRFGIIGAGIGILTGSFGRLLVHLSKLYKRLSFNRITIPKEYYSRIWYLTWPLLLGVSFSQLSGLVDNMFASYLEEGSVSALSYAKKVVELPVVVFPYVFSIVAFPYLTQLAVEKDQKALKELLSESLKWIVIIFIPVAVLFAVYSVPVIEIIFERGAFDSNSTLLTARPLKIFSYGLVFFAIETILVIFYYANADTKTPVFIGICCVILNIGLTWIFVKKIGYTGIAYALVIQRIVKNIILLFLLKRKISFSYNKILNFIAKVVLSSAAFFVTILLTNHFLYYKFSTDFIHKVIFIIICTLTGSIIYFIFLWLFKVNLKNKILRINKSY